MDQTMEIEESGSDEYYSPPKQKRRSGASGSGERYNKTRHLIRWNPLLEERLIVAIDTVTKNSGIRVPYDEVAKLIDDRSTGGAIEQHIAKLRKKTHLSGSRIAPPPRISKRLQKESPNGHLVKSKDASRNIPSIKAMMATPESGDEQYDSDWEGAMQQTNVRDTTRTHAKHHSLPSILTDYRRAMQDYPTHSGFESHGNEEAFDRTDRELPGMTSASQYDVHATPVWPSVMKSAFTQADSTFEATPSRFSIHPGSAQHGFNGSYFNHSGVLTRNQPIWYQHRPVSHMPDVMDPSSGLGRSRVLPAPITTDLSNFSSKHPGQFHQYASSHMAGSGEPTRQIYHSGFQTPLTGTSTAADYSDSNPYSAHTGSGGSFSTAYSYVPSYENELGAAMTQSPARQKTEHTQPMAWTFAEHRDRDDVGAEESTQETSYIKAENCG